MAADSSPSRSHTCLRPPQRPFRTLQFICPPFSFFHDELRVAETDPKSRRHRRPELLAPLEAGVILTWVHWITPKDGEGWPAGWENSNGQRRTLRVCNLRSIEMSAAFHPWQIRREGW